MQNNYEMIRMCILTFGLAGLSWEDMRKQQLHGWAILLLGIVMIAITIAGITALGLLVFGHKNRKSEFPFVPFLLGAHLVMWGLQG